MEWDSLKKKRPTLSLSRKLTKKQKTNTAPPILQNDSSSVKQESTFSIPKYENQTQSPLDNVITKKDEQNGIPSCQMPIEPEIKVELPSSNLQDLTMKSQPLSQTMIKDEPNLGLPLSVSQNVDIIKKDVKEQNDLKLIKEEEEEVEAWLSTIDQEHTVTNENMNIEEYHCPICSIQLASPSRLRQNHIERCLEGGGGEQEEIENLEFSECFICSKDLSKSTAEQREMHLNRCLDMKQAEEKKKKDSTFAGQSIPYIDVLNDCPVCHLPFKSKVLTYKITHLKKCARKNNISAELLKQKCRWIEWGHMPLSTDGTSNTNNKSTINRIPSHFYATDLHNDGFGEDDNDFSDKVIIHRAVSNKKIEKNLDQQDEELQAALAISLSLQVKKPKKQVFEPNAADIWTPEESKHKCLERLKQLSLEKRPLPLFNVSFKPTRFTTDRPPTFWKLASLKVKSSYLSLFIQKLYDSNPNNKLI